MHAVPRFDLEPGERLVPVREIHSEAGALIRKSRSTMAGQRGRTASSNRQSR